MKCCGIELRQVCEAVQASANGDGWAVATAVLGHLRSEIPPERATRLYIHWGNHAEQEKRKQAPASKQLDDGRRCVAFRCLSFAKKRGLLVSRGPTGGQREYWLTDKGRCLLNGKDDADAKG